MLILIPLFPTLSQQVMQFLYGKVINLLQKNCMTPSQKLSIQIPWNYFVFLRIQGNFINSKIKANSILKLYSVRFFFIACFADLQRVRSDPQSLTINLHGVSRSVPEIKYVNLLNRKKRTAVGLSCTVTSFYRDKFLKRLIFKCVRNPEQRLRKLYHSVPLSIRIK
jgi:hypothetical protein